MIAGCYHPLHFSACMLHFELVSILFGTSIPTPFNIFALVSLVFTVCSNTYKPTHFHTEFYPSRRRGAGGQSPPPQTLHSLFNLMADGMFSGMRLGQENQLRIHQNESKIILFSKLFWGRMPPDPLAPTKDES